MTNFQTALNACMNLTSSELEILMSAVRGKINEEKTPKNLRVGMKVTFDARTRGVIEGVIEKVNQKTVKVRSESRGIWNVSKTLIEVV
jgi:starvation-inducible outer membrane lipoprotein